MNSDQPNAAIRAWLAEPLAPECRRAIEKLSRTPDVQHIAVMPDVHGGSDVCTGVALATTRTLIPQAVGADIGCGMTTRRLGIDAGLLDAHAAPAVLQALKKAVPIIRHNHRSPPTLPDGCDPTALSADPLRNAARRDGTIEFGTLGRGNHFLELQRDEEGVLWMLVHTGSRAMGQAVTRHHLAAAARLRGGLSGLDAESAAGAAYEADVRWSATYARLNRERILIAAETAIAQALGVGTSPGESWGTTHNSLTREPLDGRTVLVHRKGAAPAHEGLANIIPGSMAADTYHVVGRGNAQALSSSSHGAGRAFSRTDATRRNSTRDLARQLRGVHIDPDLLPRLRDEAPAAYRDIRTVMRAQHDLVRITRRLTPVLTFKGA